MLSKTYSIFHIDLMITDHSGPKILPRCPSEYEKVLPDEHFTRIAPSYCETVTHVTRPEMAFIYV